MRVKSLSDVAQMALRVDAFASAVAHVLLLTVVRILRDGAPAPRCCQYAVIDDSYLTPPPALMLPAPERPPSYFAVAFR